MGRLEFWLKHPTWALVDWWFHRPAKHMRCSGCNSILVKGQKQSYETLLDHVSDPNEDEHPLRDTWVCNNAQCIVWKTNTFFDDYGDIYIGHHWVWEPNGVVPSSAIGSPSWNMSKNLAFQRTALYQFISFPAGRILCWFGLHWAQYRDRKDSAFCGHCHKELILNHPVGKNKVFLPAEKQKEMV